MTPFLGTVMAFAGNFAPQPGWALCDGSLLSIAQNQALFAVLGTTYGGDGRTTFALPDLRGCVPLGFGHPPTGTSINLGERAGQESTTLTSANLAPHNHALAALDGTSQLSTPTNNYLAQAKYSARPNTTLAANAVSTVGGSTPIGTMPPYLVVTYVIATEGIFPTPD
jgi:microcystin-dependent protein